MKGMKGKMMKKLKSSVKPSIAYLKPDRVLQVSALDGFVENFPLKSTFVENFPFKLHKKPHSSPKPNPKLEQPESVDAEKLMRDLEEEEVHSETHIDDKENVRPLISEVPLCSRNGTEETSPCCTLPLCSRIGIEEPSSCCTQLMVENESECLPEGSVVEADVLSFRRPDMDSGTLFDPDLLAAFEQAVSEYVRGWEEAQLRPSIKNHRYPFFRPEDHAGPYSEFDDQTDTLVEFEEKCPPGGSDSVIFYTTSVRGIRKTFEDCQSIRFLLESFGVVFYERDVSVHSQFRDELWRVMGEKALPPRLFIRGKYIGGADKVLTLHEQGRLRALFRDIPIDFSEGPCHVCTGLRFILCYSCNGSRKVFEHSNQEDKNTGGLWKRCLQCNENGLVVCPLC